jgi:site-specific DNA-methyltransferase (adenine-specific)/modification methylase
MLVLDNACGCGSFLESAVHEGRDFIGIEKYREIAGKHGPLDQLAIARRRIMDAGGQLR